MIRRLKYEEIDFEKYDRCLEDSVQRNFYANKEILDHLCKSWELLVWQDYQYMMPIPVQKKFGLKFAVMPLFCQQLGVFGNEQNPEIEERFLEYLQKNYRIVQYSFNFQNSFRQNLKQKKNYFADAKDYKILRKDYFKGRKSTVKTAQYLHFKELQVSEHLDFIKNYFKGLEKQSDIQKLLVYFDFLNSKKMLRTFGAFKDDRLINVAVMVDYGGRLSLLSLINDDNYRSDNGASFLIDRILQENISEKSFDFMGGSIRAIEVFFKSFGSQLQEYAVIENSKVDLLKNIFKK